MSANDDLMQCPCTLVEQDESCPVGYPSLLCDICNGIGNVAPVDLLAHITAQKAEIERLEGQRQVAHGEALTLAADLLQEKIAHNAAKAEIERLRAERPGLWEAGRDAAAEMAMSRAGSDPYGTPPVMAFDRGYVAGCTSCAAAIRALAPPETEGRG